MTTPAVEFVSHGTKLLLIYRPRDGVFWIHKALGQNESIDIKKTFFVTSADLARRWPKGDPDGWNDDALMEVAFVVATARGNYFVFKPEVVQVEVPVLVARDAKPTWKWFTAEEKVSVVKLLADLRPTRIVIGGDAADAIPVAEYEAMVAQFPSPYELKRYVQSRLSVVFRELSDATVDAEAMLRRYVAKKVTAEPQNLIESFRDMEVSKFEFLHEKLAAMLKEERGYPELHWQAQILDIVRLLNPKYVAVLPSVTIRDSITGGRRQLDFLLVDVDGNVDVIEIKQPFDAKIVSTTRYRDNHVPHRELAGTVTQIEKYLFHLKRWGTVGEDKLTERYRQKLPSGLRIRIVSPSGLIIMGRDHDLTPDQKADFEVFRRQNKNIVDVITYDDLLRRLKRVIEQLKARR
ncbi:Shedu immune nuclease family protein [Aquabacterium humicola]|uniref:Shedu immune nuclease family protein n=1 Tax=Aquabacterium humicola TaxID=3237377 RepID=UPI00254314CF|nr:Shedu immune nuclease family protein [Rubrivivax pictus]